MGEAEAEAEGEGEAVDVGEVVGGVDEGEGG